MIAVDTNVLVCFQRSEYPEHERAVEAIRSLAEGEQPWALPWPCVHEFLAIVTHAKIFRKPSAPEDAMDAVEALRESPTLHMIGEGPDYWPHLVRQVRGGRIRGPLVHDARIAAICLENGVRELWTADRDFSRFPALRTRNPLVC